MFIELKRHSANRFRFVHVVRSDVRPDDGGRYVRPNQIENLGTRLAGGARYLDILPVYSTYDPDCIVRIRPGRFEIDFRLGFIRKRKGAELESQTRSYISSDAPREKRMPEWRQIKLRDYLDMYERKVTRARPLGPFQQEIYDSMISGPDGDTEESVYTGAVTSFRWLMECRRQHRIMKRQLMNLTDIEEILKFDISSCPYPAWVGV